jgi:hypothetical protein
MATRRYPKAIDLMLVRHVVDLFNRAAPIGTAVVVTKDDGSEVPTKTTSAAWIPDGARYGVVMLEAISGCYIISRVRVA